MRRVVSLVALATVAMSVGSVEARAARVPGAAVQASAVTGLSLVPREGRAEVLVTVSGPVQVQDFVVPAPHRIVLDLTGARLAPITRSYDRVPRAGVSNIRLSQYRTDVVRVVLDLDRDRSYEISQEGNVVKITLRTEETFAAWHSSGQLLTEQVAEVASAARSNTATATVEAAGVVENTPPAVPAVKTVEEAVANSARMEALPAQQPRMTVTYAGADIRDVIAAFATFSGRTIVVGKDVSGTITAEIKDQPWDVALRALLEAQGLAAIEESSGIITVDSYRNILEKQASEPVATQLINVNYVSAASLVQNVQGLLYKDCAAAGGPGAAAAAAAAGAQASPGGGCVVRGSIAADSGTNSLIVSEVASRLPALVAFVRGLDVRTPQVALKAKIISISRTNIEQLGLSYDIGSSGTFYNTLLPRIAEGATAPSQFESQVQLGGDAIAGVANAQRKYRSGNALSLIFSTALGKYSLTSFLDALQESQLSDVQAEPSVVTLDNREARMWSGQETPVRVIDAGSLGQIGSPVRANVQFRETGIILTVTPHITTNRQIRMTMRAEQSELRIVGGDLGFIIDKNEARTQLLVNDGETAVIGGLVQTQIVKNKSGIPFLSGLPLIGRFFSQTDSREQKRDLLVMITPTIIDEGEAVRPPQGQAK